MMVYGTRRSGSGVQAGNTAPAYTTHSAPRGQANSFSQYSGNATGGTNYGQSYNTTGYQTQQPATYQANTTPKQPQQPQQPVQQTPVKTDQPEVMDSVTPNEDGAPEGFEKGKRMGRVPGVKYKVNKRLKRAKRNDVLRRVIKPKNSVMCLHELINGLQFNVSEGIGPDGHPKFSVAVVAYGKTYEGTGISKLIAKQNACENALKGILIDRMTKQLNKEEKGDESMAVDENGDSEKASSIPEDTIPWVNVASFALHKLFTEWQAQGTVIPTHSTVAGNLKTETPAKPKLSARPMPENPTSYNPVMLLHMVRPTTVYTETQTGKPGANIQFTVTCNVDGKTYSGVAAKKKIAKKNCAMAALTDMGVNYPATTE